MFDLKLLSFSQILILSGTRFYILGPKYIVSES